MYGTHYEPGHRITSHTHPDGSLVASLVTGDGRVYRIVGTAGTLPHMVEAEAAKVATWDGRGSFGP